MIDDGGRRGGVSFQSDGSGWINPSTGKPVNDRDLAFVVAKHIAIDIAETRQECLGKGYFVTVFDDADFEIHRGGVDSADKRG